MPPEKPPVKWFRLEPTSESPNLQTCSAPLSLFQVIPTDFVTRQLIEQIWLPLWATFELFCRLLALH